MHAISAAGGVILVQRVRRARCAAQGVPKFQRHREFPFQVGILAATLTAAYAEYGTSKVSWAPPWYFAPAFRLKDRLPRGCPMLGGEGTGGPPGSYGQAV